MIARPFFFDCETTGTDPKIHDIVQMSFQLGNDIKTLWCKPAKPESIDDEALKVTGFTREQLNSYPEPQEAMCELLNFLNNHINKFDKMDKAIFIAHNASFDWSFFNEFFYKYISRTKPSTEKPGELMPDAYVGNYFIKAPICTMHAYAEAVAIGKLSKPKGFKQAELLELHNITNTKAHDAEADMTAMRQLFYKVLCPALGWPWIE